MSKEILYPEQAVFTPYYGPQSGVVMLHVTSDLSVLVTIENEARRAVAQSGPHTDIVVGTLVQPNVRWYVLIENPNAQPATVTWRVETSQVGFRMAMLS